MTRPDASMGIFETLLLRDGRVQSLGAHLDRLAASLSELYSTPLSPGVRSEILNAARSLPGYHRLRVDAIPLGGQAHITVTTSPLTLRTSAPTGSPVIVGGGLGPHKWSDRRHLNMLAARAGPGRAALITDDDGHVLEAAWANIWLLDGERLRTPPADGRLLPGVTRARLLSLAPSLGLQADEGPISRTDLRHAPAVFLSSSLRVTALLPSRGASGPINPRIAVIADTLAAGDWS